MRIREFLKTNNIEQVRLKKYSLRIIYLWSFIIISSLAWNLWNEYDEIKSIAERAAHTHFFKEQAVQLWAASHGGVYVPVDTNTHPNPNLVHISDRDIIKPDGTILTLMSPMDILQQMVGQYPNIYGVKSKISGLKYHSEQNKPDAWEEKTIKSFISGSKQAFEYVDIDGQPFLRLMYPLITKKNCLKCHEIDGYEIGDISGGLGISLPLTPLYSIADKHAFSIGFAHLVVWTLVFGAIGFFTIRESAHLEEKSRVSKNLRASEERYRNLVEMSQTGIFVHQNGKIVYANSYLLKILGFSTVDAIIGQDITSFIPPEDIPATLQNISDMLNKQTGIGPGERKYLAADGSLITAIVSATPIEYEGQPAILLVVQDITEYKKMEERIMAISQLSVRVTGDGFFRTLVQAIAQVLHVDIVFVAEIIPADPDKALSLALWHTDKIVKNIEWDLAGTPYGQVIEGKRLIYYENVRKHFPDDRWLAKIGAKCYIGVPMLDSSGKVIGHIGIMHQGYFKNHKKLEEFLMVFADRAGAELERIQSNEQLELTQYTVDHGSDTAFWIAPDARFVNVNETACSVLGYSRDELLQMSLFDVSPDFSPNDWPKHWQEIKNRKSFRFESTHKTKSGKIFPVEVKVNYVYFKGNEYNFASAIDISKRKNAEKRFQYNERRFQTLVESASDAIVICDESGNINLYNKSAQKMFGYDAEELFGKSIKLLIPEPYRNHYESFMHAVETGRLGEFDPLGKLHELVGLKKDKSTFPLEISFSIWNVEGKTYFTAIIRDISKRKRDEDELRKLSAAIEQSPASVVITNVEGIIEYVNTKFVKLTGYSYEEAVGKNPRILKSSTVAKEAYEEMWKTILAGKEWRGEFLNVKKNGDTYWEDAVVSPIFNDQGDICHLLAVKEDITDRKKAEVEKKNLEKQIRQSQKMETIGALAGGIAHDFNNILSPIMGYTDLVLMNLGNNHPLAEGLKQVKMAALRAKELVEQILLFSKKKEKKKSQISMSKIVDEALLLLRPSIPTSVAIHKEVITGRDTIFADATQIHQVVVNLCTNAWQAMEDKGGILTVKLEEVQIKPGQTKKFPSLKNGTYVCLSVIDTGNGMDETIREHVFEPFFTTKKNKGTGLGLSVVHGIVSSHDGDIVIESEPGKGTAMHIYLPLIEHHFETDTEDDTEIVGGSEYILVLDDEEAIANLVKDVLRNFGYKAVAFNDVEKAITTFEKFPGKYDLLITDLTMPDMSGLDVADHVHKIRPDIPIVIMTGQGQSLASEILEKHGIAQIVDKPLNIKNLMVTIRNILISQSDAT